MNQYIAYIPKNMEKSNLIISHRNSENIFKLPDNLIIKKIFANNDEIMLGFSGEHKTLGVFSKKMINYLNINNPDFFDNEEKLYESEAETSLLTSKRDKIFNTFIDPKLDHDEIVIHCENN